MAAWEKPIDPVLDALVRWNKTRVDVRLEFLMRLQRQTRRAQFIKWPAMPVVLALKSFGDLPRHIQNLVIYYHHELPEGGKT